MGSVFLYYISIRDTFPIYLVDQNLGLDPKFGKLTENLGIWEFQKLWFYPKNWDFTPNFELLHKFWSTKYYIGAHQGSDEACFWLPRNCKVVTINDFKLLVDLVGFLHRLGLIVLFIFDLFEVEFTNCFSW